MVRMRRIDGELHIAMDEEAFVLSEEAEQVWLLCDGSQTLREISRSVAERSSEALADVQAEVTEFVRELINAEMLVVASKARGR
jgi:hypothetical protein